MVHTKNQHALQTLVEQFRHATHGTECSYLARCSVVPSSPCVKSRRNEDSVAGTKQRNDVEGRHNILYNIRMYRFHTPTLMGEKTISSRIARWSWNSSSGSSLGPPPPLPPDTSPLTCIVSRIFTRQLEQIYATRGSAGGGHMQCPRQRRTRFCAQPFSRGVLGVNRTTPNVPASSPSAVILRFLPQATRPTLEESKMENMRPIGRSKRRRRRELEQRR